MSRGAKGFATLLGSIAMAMAVPLSFAGAFQSYQDHGVVSLAAFFVFFPVAMLGVSPFLGWSGAFHGFVALGLVLFVICGGASLILRYLADRWASM